MSTPIMKLGSLALACLWIGCATPVSTPETSPEPAEAARRAPAVPPAVRDALLPELGALARGPEAPQEARFDVTVLDAPANEFFASLVEGTPHNLVVDPAVTGTISLRLRNVTVREVLEAAWDAYGYPFRETHYGYHVLPGGLQTRVFQIDYLNVQRFGTSVTRVSSGQVSDSGQGANISFTDETDEGESNQGGTTSGSLLDTRSSVDFWGELVAALDVLLAGREGRSIVPSPHAGVIVVRATPGELREVEAFLDSVQLNLNRQVILDAKILEVELSDGFQSGINWAALATHNDQTFTIGQTGGGEFFDTGVSEIAGNTGLLDPLALSLPSGTDTSAFGGVFSVAVAASRFAGFIELLETQGDVHILSSPRISTVNNQKAVIKVGSDEFFVTDVSSTTVTGTATTTSPDIELTPFFSGIALDVTPQISDAGQVVLHIHPSVSEVRDQTKNVTVGGEVQTLPLAFSTIRESDTVIRAGSGQLVVIGGLMEDVERDSSAGIPLASRIPLLGRLFRHEQDTTRKRELVILLRPTIVGDETWDQHLEGTRERLRSMRVEPENWLPAEGQVRVP